MDPDDAANLLEKLDFHHPYTPYDVQEQFMKTVYAVLDKGDGQVGILESPTGTVSLMDALAACRIDTLASSLGQIFVPHMRVSYLAATP